MDDVAIFLRSLDRAAEYEVPFRHITMDGVLAADLATDISGAGMSTQLVRLRDQRGTQISDRRFRVPVLPGAADVLPDPVRRLRALLAAPAVVQALLSRFADVIGARLRAGSRVRTSLDLIEDRTGYELLPHTDQREKLVTLLIYLADEPEGVELGTTIYRPLVGPGPGQGPWHYDRKPFRAVKTVPHRVNTALCFPPCASSFHGVEPVAPGARRFLAQYHLVAVDKADLTQ